MGFNLENNKRGAILKNIEIKKYKNYNEQEILDLYKSVGWSNYYNKPSMLKEAYENSLDIIGAYLNEELVGIIRVVGDGSSILYIQDILVSPIHQQKGIGRKLFENITNKYQNVYQKVLITDNTEKTRKFYKNMGFIELDKMEGVCFVNYTFN